MKITAEFNSNEELLSFIGAFGAKNSIPSQEVTNVTALASDLVEIKKVTKSEVVKKEDKPVAPVKEDKPVEEIIPDNSAELQKEIERDQKESEKEEVNITKEMVRERLGAIMKAGKQKEVKALVALHGAGKLPDLKEEEYAAVYEEAGALL